MKKNLWVLSALAACLAASSASAAAADQTIGTMLKAKYSEAPASKPNRVSKFNGKVGPDECAERRTVRVTDYGKAKTDSNGKFEFPLEEPADPGKYRVKVEEKKIAPGVSCSKVKLTLRLRR